MADKKRMDVSAIALQGLQQADLRLQNAVAAIVSAGVNSPDGASLDVVSLSAELVAMMSAQNLYDANLATLRTADQRQKSLINVMA